jgi:hypothetical protein
MSKQQFLPDFVVIGAGKSGTTSLDHYLTQHPDIFMSPMKEPDFFAYETMDLSGLQGRDLEHYNRAVKNIEDYQKLFKGATPGQVKGEVSNTCLSSELAVDRMKFYIPNAKLIAILRQPTDRLFSRYMHLIRIGRLPATEFSDVLDRNSIWWRRKDLIPEGYYAKNLSRFFASFPAENIKIILTEDLKKDPNSVMNELFKFLNVDPDYSIDYSVEHNKSGVVANQFYDKTIGSNSFIKKSLKAILPETTYSKITRVPLLKQVTQNLNNANLKPPQKDVGLLKQITHDIYRQDIQELSKLIDRDLSEWLNYPAE